jgi:transposase
MTRPPNVQLRPLSGAEFAELIRVSKATSARWDHVRRAQALLAVVAHQSFTTAARTAGFRSSSTIPALITRVNAGGLAALAVAPGRGRKPTYDAATRQRILARAQHPPDRKQDGTATWSLHSLQEALRTAPDGFPTLGRTTIRRVLHAVGYSHQRTRTWCPTGTAQRVRKEGVVTVSDPHTAEKIRWIEHAYRIGETVGLAVYCEDEAGPYQAIPQPGTTWRPTAQPARQPHEYVRGGTAKGLSFVPPGQRRIPRPRGPANDECAAPSLAEARIGGGVGRLAAAAREDGARAGVGVLARL